MNWQWRLCSILRFIEIICLHKHFVCIISKARSSHSRGFSKPSCQRVFHVYYVGVSRLWLCVTRLFSQSKILSTVVTDWNRIRMMAVEDDYKFRGVFMSAIDSMPREFVDFQHLSESLARYSAVLLIFYYLTRTVIHIAVIKYRDKSSHILLWMKPLMPSKLQ